MPLLIAPQFSIPDAELEFSFARSSGPGGQNVNKVNSKAVLRWNARASQAVPLTLRPFLLARLANQLTVEGEIILTSDEYRDQPRNREACLDKLRDLLLLNSRRPKSRKPTKPTYSSKKRKLEGKRMQSNKKEMRGSYRGD
jgi:ribosome-associated protein